MIRRCEVGDFDLIYDIVNDGALAYKGVIPKDRLREPYMSKQDCDTRSMRELRSGDLRRMEVWQV